MKRNIFFGIISGLVFLSCNNRSNQGSTNSADSSISPQNNTASVPPNNNTSNPSDSNSGTGTFNEVMHKMMNDMQTMRMTEDPDNDFASMMKLHHQGAIDMSNVELSKGTNADLKKIAQNIIDAAQKDINELNSFLKSHQPSKKSEYGQKQMQKMMSMKMNMQMNGNTDQEFATMMTMHHQEGIDMAKDYLKVGTAMETKKVANNTIQTNSEDIKKLKAFANGNMDNMENMKSMDMKNMNNMKDNKKDNPVTDHSQH